MPSYLLNTHQRGYHKGLNAIVLMQ
uniref:Uncharacterized protein n=1 Tax=Arundo donax TaxID=35708 RepID=A0A0A9ARG3_ARUDO